VNLDEVQPGDIVTPLLTPGDSYEVLTVMPNGILDCKSLRTGVQMGMRPTAVSLVQKAQPTEKIEFNDLVEVIDDGNDCVGLVGSFGRVKIIGESRIGVEIDEQVVYFKSSELRIKAKEEKVPQRQRLQVGRVLMGDRIVTSGKYIGEGRVSQLLSAKLGTADKIATIQLAKDLKNLGFDPRLAATVMVGELDDASDF
jgi:preprotein translocase subunit YajC